MLALAETASENVDNIPNLYTVDLVENQTRRSAPVFCLGIAGVVADIAARVACS